MLLSQTTNYAEDESINVVQHELASVLVIEDRDDHREFISSILRSVGLHVFSASNMKEAFSIIDRFKHSLDIIFIDIDALQSKSLKAIHELKKDTYAVFIPIIMLLAEERSNDGLGYGVSERIGGGIKEGIGEGVGEGIVESIMQAATSGETRTTRDFSEENADVRQECIDAGVMYFLNQPLDLMLLKSVIHSAARERRHSRHLQDHLDKSLLCCRLMYAGKFRIQSLNEVSALCAYLSQGFPEPQRVMTGLSQILINAVEHGNLEIGFETKTQLIQTGEWEHEINRRLALPEYSERYVDVVYKKTAEGYFIKVTDQGSGFDWHSYLSIDPQRACHSHGRGIAHAHAMCFDELEYNQMGNEVVLSVYSREDVHW